MIKLSVIVPIYNCEKYILECISSIYNTGYNDEFEVILIDDGSIDNSRDICKELSIKYKNMSFIYNKKNRGVSYSRNKGIEKAKGKYLLFVDADDYLDIDWYVIVRDKLKINKDIFIINNLLKDIINIEDLILNVICLKQPYLPGVVTRLYKKSFIDNNKIRFNEKIINGEDIIFNLETLIYNPSYFIINDSFYNYRIYDGSSTNSFNSKIFESTNEYLNVLDKLLKRSVILEDYRKIIINNIIYSNVYILFYRLSFEKYFKNRKLYRFVTYDPYKIVLSRRDNTVDFGIKYNIVFFLVRWRLFFVIWLFFRFINGFKNKEKFIKNNF